MESLHGVPTKSHLTDEERSCMIIPLYNNIDTMLEDLVLSVDEVHVQKPV